MAVLNRRTLLGTSLAAAVAPIIGRPVLGAEPVQVGFVYSGPVGDYGWTLAHDRGRAALETEFGDRVRVIVMPQTSEDASAIPVIRDLAQQGCKLIFATAGGYAQQVAEVARDFSEVAFEVCDGLATAANVATYAARLHEARAVAGALAGMLPGGGMLGYLGAYRLPEAVRGANAFLLAAQRHRPEARLSLAFVNRWFDPPAEIAATTWLAERGAAIVAGDTDSPAALQTLEPLGRHGFAQSTDLREYAPEAQLSAIEHIWGRYYVARTRALLEGTWTSAATSLGIADGALALAPFGPAVTADAALAAERIAAGYRDGSFDIFTGPIHDQSGSLRVAEGERLAPADLAGMDWFVQGVDSTIWTNGMAGTAE